VWQRDGYDHRGHQNTKMFATQLCAGYMIPATSDKHEPENVFAEKVERVEEFLAARDVKADEQAQERKR